MKVSIIIPVYNVEAYLRACLDSILTQTESSWECILIDDASTDSSPAICREYLQLDSRFRLITHSDNSGLSAARNSGIAAAQAPRLTFVDSDDALHPQFLQVGLSSQADIVGLAFTYTGKYSLRGANRRTCIAPRRLLRNMLYQTGPITHSVSGKIFASHLFTRLRFEEGILYEDLAIAPRLLLAARTAEIIPCQLYHYRQRPGSIITTWNARRLDVLRITERHEQSFANDPELRRAAADRRFAANWNMLLLMRRHGLSNSPEAASCREEIRRLRFATLLNPHSCLKHRLAALLPLP